VKSNWRFIVEPNNKLPQKLLICSIGIKNTKTEIAVLEKLHHASIIGLVDFERCSNGRGIIYLEYQPDPTLASYIQNVSTLSEPQAVKVLYSLADAVHYIHSLGISHHDIKPDNILFNCGSNSIKLFDFGLALTVDSSNPISSSNGGSPLYMAPEILLKKTHNVFSSDIWSIGITLYEILVGVSPFDTCKNLSSLKKEWSKRKDISIPKHVYISSKLRMVYAHMVKYEPEKRISSLELKKILVPLLTKKSLGNSLGGSNGKTKTERTSSVNAIIRNIQVKKRVDIVAK